MVNNNGVLRLVKNVHALQQNLTNLASGHQASLERARSFYETIGFDGKVSTYNDEYTFPLTNSVISAGAQDSNRKERHSVYIRRLQIHFGSQV